MTTLFGIPKFLTSKVSQYRLNLKKKKKCGFAKRYPLVELCQMHRSRQNIFRRLPQPGALF